jgi:type III pantothenate kinase
LADDTGKEIMNIIALDIGNSNITAALFLDDEEKDIVTVGCSDTAKLREHLVNFWDRMPLMETSTERKKDGVIVGCSVNSTAEEIAQQMCSDELDEKMYLIGKDVRLPIELGIDHPETVGTDRVVSAAAAFAVVEKPVIVADIGTAVTIDLVDEEGVFLGGVIAPGFAVASKALKMHTSQLPEISVSKPLSAIGGDTEKAINSGLYYSVVGLLRTISEQYATELGSWPQMIVTGSGAGLVKDDCEFVDNWVPDLVVKGVAMAWKKHQFDKNEVGNIVDKLQEDQEK